MADIEYVLRLYLKATKLEITENEDGSFTTPVEKVEDNAGLPWMGMYSFSVNGGLLEVMFIPFGGANAVEEDEDKESKKVAMAEFCTRINSALNLPHFKFDMDGSIISCNVRADFGRLTVNSDEQALPILVILQRGVEAISYAIKIVLPGFYWVSAGECTPVEAVERVLKLFREKYGN